MDAISLSNYVPPTDVEYDEYAKVVQRYSANVQANVKCWLDEITSEIPHVYAIATTGSDGRFEKDPYSPFEIVVMVNTGAESEDFANITKLEGLYEVPEIKDIGKDTMSYYNNNPSKVFPSRIFDILHLAGNEAHIDAARNKLAERLRAL